MPIEYNLWMYGKKYNHNDAEGPLYARNKPIISNVPILQKGMIIRIDGANLEIESIELDLEYEEEYSNTIDIEDDIEVHVYIKTDSFIETICTKEEGMNGWRNINFSIEQ